MKKVLSCLCLMVMMASVAHAEIVCEILESNDSSVRASGVDDGGEYFYLSLICDYSGMTFLAKQELGGHINVYDKNELSWTTTKAERAKIKFKLKSYLRKEGFKQTESGEYIAGVPAKD